MLFSCLFDINSRIKSAEVDQPLRVEADARDPKTLVEGAARLLHEDKKDAKKESYDPFAVVWAVTDVDDFGKNGDKLRAAMPAVIHSDFGMREAR